MSFADPARVAQVTQPYSRYAAAIPAAAALPDAQDETVVTDLQSEAGAIAVHARLADLLDPTLRRWSVFAAGRDFQIAVGQTVTLTHPRYGLAAGRRFLLLGVRDVAGEGAYLTLLGGVV